MAGADLQDGGLMRLALSSAAAPDADVDALLGACRRRGFPGVELGTGHRHGLTGVERAAARGVRVRMSEKGVDVVGFRLPVPAAGDAEALATFARALEAPAVLVPQDEGVRPALDALEVAEAVAAGGGRALVSLRGASTEAASVRTLADRLARLPSPVGVAWEVDPERPGDPGRVAHELVEGLGRRLRLIRLRGGGPEAARQEGLGVGALMGTLALAGYDGPLVLAPTSSRYRVAWSAWLGRRGGWGCGSRTADPELVQLVTAPGTAEAVGGRGRT